MAKPMAENNNLEQLAEQGLAQSELWAEFWHDPDSGDALRRLVEAFLPFAHKVLERISINLPSHVAIEDLLQAAALGLYHAITRFNPERGVSFEAFARPRIRGAILDELRVLDHVSRQCRSNVKRIEVAVRDWMRDHGGAPTDEELAGALDLTVSQLHETMDRSRPWLSLDDLIVDGRNGSLSLRDILADPKAGAPDHDVELKDLLDHTRKAFLQLSGREQKILYFYYFEELRLSEIARLYSVTEARVSQIHAMAIAKLRAILCAATGRDDPWAKDSNG